MDNIIVILFLVFVVVLIVLDIAMLISLIKPGDERKQMVVWKASTYTLLGMVGSMMIGIIENLIKGEALYINPFVQLGVTATMYFMFLLYYKRKHGG